MATHRDPTGAQATGNVQREWMEMAALAIRVRRSRNRSWASAQEKRFIGIFRRLLTDPEEEILSDLPPKVRRRLADEGGPGA